jgi:hypothetical protein
MAEVRSPLNIDLDAGLSSRPAFQNHEYGDVYTRYHTIDASKYSWVGALYLFRGALCLIG